MRCFIGTFVDPSCLASILAIRPELPNVRWVKPDKFHMTLEFFGNLDQAAIPRKLDQVSNLQSLFPIRCCSGQLDGFPNWRAARVVVLRLALNEGLSALEQHFSDLTPHVTLGYVRRGRIRVSRQTFDIAIEFPRVDLIESRDGQYSVIDTV